MADIPESTMGWMKFWGDLQRQSLDNWQSTMRQSAPTPASMGDNPLQFWKESVNQWWRVFERTSAPTPEQTFWNNIQNSGDWFFKMGEEAFRLLQGVQDGSRAGRDWTDALHQIMGQAKDAIQRTFGMDLSKGAYGLYGMPMDTMQRVMAATSFFPGDIFKSFKAMKLQPGAGLDPAMKANLEQFLSTPAIGYTREWQEQHQQVLLQMVEYQEAAQDYFSLLGRGFSESVDILHRRLLERGASDKPIHSMKELYNLMVDCGEDAFAAMAQTREYGQANARLINAMMRIKNQSRLLMEEGMNALNMPSRTELDTAHHNILELKRRVRALEDEVRALKKKDVAPEISALKEDVEQLPIKEFRSELEKLKKQMQDSLQAPEKGEGEVEGETGDALDGDDKAEGAGRGAPVRRARTTRPKPQSEGV